MGKRQDLARQKLDRIFQTGRINAVPVSISRGHSIKWDPPENAGFFGIPDGSRKYIVAPATIAVDDFLRVQASTRSDFSFTGFLSGAYDPTVERAAESIRSGRNDIPTPILEIRTDGSLMQEGRSRAVGAQSAGATRMPIWIAIQVYR